MSISRKIKLLGSAFDNGQIEQVIEKNILPQWQLTQAQTEDSKPYGFICIAHVICLIFKISYNI
jgi:enhancing lycopene biosynthesis protein 2